MPGTGQKSIHDQAYHVLVDLLRVKRTESGLTQDEMAERLGWNQSDVSKYERSERRLDIIEVRSICGVLGTNLIEFVSEYEARIEAEVGL